MKANSCSGAILVAASLVVAAYVFAQEEAETTKTAGSFAAASESTRELRRSLLERRWNYSKENRAAAVQEYAAIKASGEATAADDLLYGVVQFRQHDYEASAAALTSALAAMPEDRMTLKTRICTAVERSELEAVWPLLSRLQRVVCARAKDPAIPAEAQRDDLVFLGQLHGYLAGPYEDLESERLLVSLRDEVAAQMPLRALSVFEEAERSVEDRYDRISTELDILVAAEEEARQAETEAKLAELEARREDLRDDKSKIDPEREKITDVSRETLGALSEAEMLAASSVQTAERQAEALRIEYQGVLRGLELLYTEKRAREGQNPTQTSRTGAFFNVENRIGLFWQALNNLEAQMDALQRDHAQLNFNFQQIRRQRLASETELQQNVARLAWDGAQIERELDALKKQAEKVVDPKRKVSPEVRLKEREMTSLGTYVDFCLEVPRTAALAALKGR